MKKNLLCLLAFFLFFASSVFAQTTLVAGDIAFTGYNTDDNTVNGPTANDDFSFILLKNITAGTVINFTDFGWRSDAAAFQTANPCGASTGAVTDGIIQWTATTNMSYGTQIRIRCRNNLSATLGSVTGIQATFNVATDYLTLASAGDQIFAYQGSFASPTLLAGISANGPWDATVTDCLFSSTASTLPAALNSNNYAVAIDPEVDNARLKSSVTLTGNAATDRAAIHNVANWDVDDLNAFLLPPVLTAAPVVTTSAGNTAHTQGTPVVVDAAITVTDADNANLSSATISITGNFQSAEDVLQFTNQNGITGSYNSATGVLSLSGSSTVANYQTALRSIQYNNTAIIPNTSNRTISFRANDGTVNSNIATKIVTVTALNPAPVVTTSGGNTAFTQGTPVVVDGSLTVTDANSANLVSATVSITGGFQNSQDVLQFTNQNGITGSYNSSTGVLSLSGSATVANYQTALRSVIYNNTSATPNTANRTISFIANDGTVSSNTATKTVTVTATNAAPVVTTSAGITAHTQGTPVAVDGAITVTDADNANLSSATISITGNFQSAEDVLQFTNQNGITGSYNSATGVLSLSGSSTVANYQTALRSITYNNTSATPNTTNRIVSFTASDGTTNSNTATKTVSVTSSAVGATTLAIGDIAFTGYNSAGTDDFSFIILRASGITSGTQIKFTDYAWVSGACGTNGWGTTVEEEITWTATTTLTYGMQVRINGLTASTGTVTGTALNLSQGGDQIFAFQGNRTGVYTMLAGIHMNQDAATSATNWDDVAAPTGTSSNRPACLTNGTYALFINPEVDNARLKTTVVLTGNPATDRAIINNAANWDVDDLNPFILPPVFNAASVVTTSAGTTTYSLGTPVAVDGALTVSDPDDVNLSSATVSITVGFQSGQDILQFSNQNGITGSYNAATGILTLTGTSTVGNYQTALRSVTYNNTSATPDKSNRTVSFVTNDGNANSNTATKGVVFLNEAPVVTTSAGNTAYAGTPVMVDGGITVTDADNATLSSATVSITGNFQSAEDVLQFTDQNGITGSYNSATGVLSLSGSSTVANYQAALRSITYNNTSAAPNTFERTISFSVNDGIDNSNTATKTISIPPRVTVNQAPGQNDPANTSPVLFRVQFSETVNGFTASDVIVSGPAGSTATVLAPTPAEQIAGTYTVSVTGMTADGTITVSIGAGAVTDLAGNANSASTSTDNTVTYDATKPTVTINQAAAQVDPTNTSPINFTVVFSEPVSNFATGDITLSGTANATTAVVTGSGTTYNVAVSGMSTSGTVIATIGAGVATDAAGNDNTASTSTDNTVTYDIVAPTVTIEKAAAQADPTSAATVNFTVVFSEPVSNFATGDVTLSGTAGATTAVVTGSGTTYNVAVSGMTQTGTVIASIGANVATDAAGNNNTASNSATVNWVLDEAPTVSSINRLTPLTQLTNASTVTFRVIFSEDVTGVDASDFELTKTLTANGSVNTVTLVDDHTYDVNVNSVTGDGTLRLDLKSSGTGIKDKDGVVFNDIAGGFTSGQTYTLDHTAPTLTSVSISSSNVNSALAKVGDKVTVLFTASEAIQTPTVTIQGQAATVSYVLGNQWKGEYTMQASDAPEGVITFSIAFTDLAANAGTSVTTTTDASSVTFDKTLPILTNVHIQSNNANTAKAKVGDIVTLSFTSGEAVTGTSVSIAGHPVAVNSAGGNSYTASYTMVSGDAEGAVAFSISGFKDAAGNTGTAVTATTDASTVTFDKTAPILTVVTIASNNANTAYAKPGDKVTLLFTSSEGIQTPTVSILGHSVTPSVVTGNQWKAEYTTVNTDAEGTIAFQVSGLTDLTGNTNATSVVATTNGSSVIYDKTAPAVGACPANQTPFAGANCTANVSWTVPTATDANVAGAFSAYEHTGGDPGIFNIGNYTIVYKFKDPAGNETICSFTVTVADNSGPTFTTPLTANPVVLWPPDHKLKDIVLTYVTADNCSGTVTNTITVTSTDPITGVSDGDKSPDWIVVNDHLVQLRAERGNGKESRIYTITVTPTDASGNVGTAQSVQVYISHNITAPFTGTSFKIGSTVDFAGVFWDKPGNTHTANWTIDDNTTVNGAVTEPSGAKNGKVTGSYKFTTAGIYKLRMNVTDQNRVTSYANTNEDLEEIIVVYDPNGGYTYGGGWFNSPAGALSADPGATGKISYGFSVNYHKDATLPKGETQFKFEVGGLEYNALNFEYLSINGAKAVFKGSGKIIGGQSGINFFMSVIDGQIDGTGVDKVRIKIYNKNTGAVIYDNQPGASEAADATTSVGAASSVTIVGSNISSPAPRITSKDQNIRESLQMMALPNPSRNYFTLALKGSRTEQVTLRITDVMGRVVEVRRGIAANGTVKIGDNYRPGTYIAEVIQGSERVRVMLIKQSD